MAFMSVSGEVVTDTMMVEEMINFIEDNGYWTFYLSNTYCWCCKLKRIHDIEYSQKYVGASCYEVLTQAVNYIKQNSIDY